MIDSTSNHHTRAHPNTAERPSPYVGPRPFQIGEQLYGRNRDVSRLLNLLIAERIVLLHSPSGAGKTSLIQAALVPRLQAEEFHVLPIMRVNLVDSAPSQPTAAYTASTTNGETPPMRHGNPYILSALLALEEEVDTAQQMPIEHLAAMTLPAYLDRQIERMHTDNPDETPSQVLIFDQFEEILTTNPTSQTDKVDFFAQLGVALRDRRRWALFAMREDYMGGLEPYLLTIPTRFKATFRLDLLTEKAARIAIQEPARDANAAFSDAAATRLVNDLRLVRVQQPDGSMAERPGLYVEPVQLQVVCYRLWAHLPPDDWEIDEADVASLGDVNTALADYYAECVQHIEQQSDISERVIREWCNRHLITPQGLRGQVLQNVHTSAGLPNEAIYALIDAHLVHSEKRRGATWFELAHDRLIEPICSNNTAWFEQHLTLLQRQAALWEQRGRPESLLLRGKDFKQAEAELQTDSVELTAIEDEFLAACLRERRQGRLRRRLTIFSAVVALIAIAAAVSAVMQAERAREAQTVAEEKQEDFQNLSLAYKFADLSAAELALHHAPRSLLLAIEANHRIGLLNNKTLPAAEEALRRALTKTGGTPLSGHADAVTVTRFSPDGQWLATASWDTTVRLWRMTDPQRAPLLLHGHTDGITHLAFSADGQWLATASADATVRLWMITDPAAEPRVLRGHTDVVNAVAFSPDGQWLATASNDTTIRLWSMADANTEPVVLGGHTAAVTHLAFSPNGAWLATAGVDATIRLVNMGDSYREPLVFAGHQAAITALAFSADGQSLASASQDSTVRLWSMVDLARKPLVLRGHTEGVHAIAFSADGEWLASASADTTIHLWSMSSMNDRPTVLTGHEHAVVAVAFSTDGQLLISASDDSTLRLWSMEDLEREPLVLSGHTSWIHDIALSSNGQWLASASDDGSARLWRMPPAAEEPVVLRGGNAGLSELVYQPGGSWLATADAQSTILLWDTSRPGSRSVVLEGDGVCFSPDGVWLAVTRRNGAARLWNMDDPQAAPVLLDAYGDEVAALVFAPDSHLFATLSSDGTMRLWELHDPASGVDGQVVTRDSAPEAGISFSPAGEWLATITRDGSIQMWDTANLGSDPLWLPVGDGGVHRVAFSPDGQWLAALDTDTSVWVWSMADLAAEPVQLTGHTTTPVHLAFSTDGHWLVSVDDGAGIRLWDMHVDTLPTAGVVLRGVAGSITDIAFSPDSIRLAVASSDSTTRLWNLNAPDSKPVVLEGHTDRVDAVAFSPDGARLATASNDATVRIWRVTTDSLIELACAVTGRNLTTEEWEQFVADFAEEVPYHQSCPDLSTP